MTLLEQWDQYMADGGVGPKNDEIRRAIGIAQAVESGANSGDPQEMFFARLFVCRADEFRRDRE